MANIESGQPAETPAAGATSNPYSFGEVGQWGQNLSKSFLGLIQNGDIMLPIGVMMILGMLLVPLPTWLLDLLLAFSITIAVVVLMTVIFVASPIELTSFPTILLLAALLRLGLNVASTRLILSEGHTGTDAAGMVIQSFGNFVAGGNYVIGVIVFAILVIINFIVITKGAGRIAEVAARFALDSMPGKQMAIDADLSSGLIDEKSARQKRKDLNTESSFYGAMDGASKFVRGDAIAGLLITFINVIGGIVIGVMQRDMDLSVAAENYTLLTIGDGLVSQVPALIISVGAGILVTKSGIDGGTERALADQISSNPMALMITATLLLLLAMIPGLPAFPFMMMFLVAAGTGYYVYFARDKKAKQVVAEQNINERATQQGEHKKDLGDKPIDKILYIDNLRLELGYGLLPLTQNKDEPGGLGDQVRALRENLATRYGFILPMVRMQDNLQLSASEYRVIIKEIEAGGSEIRSNMLLCISNDGDDAKFTIRGEKTREPTWGLPAIWISENMRDEAVFQGYTVIEPVAVITTHLSELVQNHMAEFLTYSETQKLIDQISEVHKPMISEIVSKIIPIPTIQKVLQSLLRERVSIRDLPLIIEGIADAAANKKGFVPMVEHVRGMLARQINHELLNVKGEMILVGLSPRWDQTLHESLTQISEGEFSLTPDPTVLRDFVTQTGKVLADAHKQGENPCLLVSHVLRPYVRSLLFRHFPQLTVISHNEIYPGIKFNIIGHI